ncbi:signal peptidase I [Curtobacterium sp. MCJR17_020]|uniref:signal peptidase I n=1 Tax=Curtobacterium sp. MCJR17_020 TaxID=2175619 RepID=UPI0021ACFE84|nr:signal peptidase I [Curtobacterium sp. MCJR17_020]WIE74097.1 signal peptidase I [Curtobacterium sp. MCJR17_020]
MSPQTPARQQQRPRERVLRMVRGLLFNVAAAGGAVCIILVILALTLHITLIMFRTGSMAPTIPTGSLAIVKQIPAAEAHVGQVVTVDRAGQLPITHRVVSVTPNTDGSATLQLRGDANDAADPNPYRVSHVRLVIWSAPRLAYAVVWLSQPAVVGGLALGVAALVMWSLWPDREAADTDNPAPDTVDDRSDT